LIAGSTWDVSWQSVPEVLPRLFNDPDTAAASRARAAMMQMKKIDIAALEAAFHSAFTSTAL
jgi:predicted 3-demethylubiquinone-9 3-methyltransferase (glyoxalase superfamily)